MSHFHSALWKILKALMSEGICTPAEKTWHLILSLAKTRSILLSHKLPDNTKQHIQKLELSPYQIVNQLSWTLLLRQFLSEIKIGSLITAFRRMLHIPEIRLNAINLTKQFRRNYHINVKSIMEELPHECSSCQDLNHKRVSGSWQTAESTISTIICFAIGSRIKQTHSLLFN